MHDLALMAATEWARTNNRPFVDPVEFGHKVALAYLACSDTAYHAGDENATTAALVALSVRPEVLQAMQLLASLSLPMSPVTAKTESAGTEA